MAFNGIGINHGDEYYTPRWFVDMFGVFDYDPATTKGKADEFGIKNYDTIETDGLKTDWTKYGRIWCNPPFTKKYEFISKAIDTYNKSGVDIFIVIPISSLTTVKFHSTGFKGKVYVPNKRLCFETPKGVVAKSPSMGSIVIKPDAIDTIEYIKLKGDKG